MAPRETAQRRARWALTLIPIVVTIFAVTICLSTTNGLWAQGTNPPPAGGGQEKPASKANPMEVQRLVSLKTQFLQDLNQALENPQSLTQGRKVVVLVDHKVWRDIVEDRAIVVIDSAKTVQLSHADLQQFHDYLARQIDEAIKLEQAGKGGGRRLGQGTYSNHVFTGKLKPVGGEGAMSK